MVLLVGLPIAAWLGQRAVASWVWTKLDVRPQPPKTLPVGLASLSAETCRACHPTQYADWSNTRMAQAMIDPVFLADWRSQGNSFVCIPCHAPLTEQQPTLVTGLASVRPLRPIASPNPLFDPALQQEGVTCVACHLADDGVIVGPEGRPAPHATRRDPSFREAERCVGCHQVEIPPLANLDRPLADTHREWEVWKAVTGRTETCTDCHMPNRRHVWSGAWDATLLAGGLGVTARRVGDAIEVTLENRAGHRFPSADPARALVVRAGEVEVVIARRVPLPRFRDEGDDTLLPDETRVLTLASSASEVVVAMQPVRFLSVAAQPPEIVFARVSVDENAGR